MNAGAQSVGQILREAREARGMTLDDASARLRLMHRQVEAMEADDFDALGQPVFARGFVRNYARLLGLAPETLLASMEGGPAEPAAVSYAKPPLQRSWLASPWLILLVLSVLVVLAVPVGLYLWLNSEVDEEPRQSYAARSHSRAAAAPPGVASVPPAAAPAETEHAPAAAAEPDASAAAGTAEDAAASTAPASPADAAENAVPGGAEASAALHLEFGAEAWTEIKDATGRAVHRQLNPAGSSVDVQGEPPFKVVIGNAAEARMTFNGRPVDLKPHIDVTVARFTLE